MSQTNTFGLFYVYCLVPCILVKKIVKKIVKKKNWLKAEKRSLLYTDSFLIISAKLVFDKCVSTNQHNSKFTQNTKTVSAVDTKLEVKPFNHRLQKTQRKDLG